MIHRFALALCLFVVVADFEKPVFAAGIPTPPPDQQWAKYVVDHLDVLIIRSSIYPRRQEGKVTFADYGLMPIALSIDNAKLTTAESDWYFTVNVLEHDSHSILICMTDVAANGGSYFAGGPITLVMGDDGTHLRGETSSEMRADCPEFAGRYDLYKKTHEQ